MAVPSVKDLKRPDISTSSPPIPVSTPTPHETEETGARDIFSYAARPVTYEIPRVGLLWQNAAPKEGTIDLRLMSREDLVQLAISTKDEELAKRLAGHMDIEVRTALATQNRNFEGLQWFKEFRTPYVDYPRLARKVKSSPNPEDVDLSSFKDIDTLIEIASKFEEDEGVRFAIVKNKSLTPAQRALFFDDPSIKILKFLGQKPDVTALFDRIATFFKPEIRGMFVLQGDFLPKENEEKFRLELEEFKKSQGPAFDAFMFYVAQRKPCRKFKGDTHLHILRLAPIDEGLFQKLLQLNDDEVTREILTPERLAKLSNDELWRIYSGASFYIKSHIVSWHSVPLLIAEDYYKQYCCSFENLKNLISTHTINAHFDEIIEAIYREYGNKPHAYRDLAVFYTMLATNPHLSREQFRKLEKLTGNICGDNNIMMTVIRAKLLQNNSLDLMTRMRLCQDRDMYVYVLGTNKPITEQGGSGGVHIDDLIEKMWFHPSLSDELRDANKKTLIQFQNEILSGEYNHTGFEENFGNTFSRGNVEANIYSSRFTPPETAYRELYRVMEGRIADPSKNLYDRKFSIDAYNLEMLAKRKDLTPRAQLALIIAYLNAYPAPAYIYNAPWMTSELILKAVGLINDGGSRLEYEMKQDMIQTYLSYHPVDAVIRDYVLTQPRDKTGEGIGYKTIFMVRGVDSNFLDLKNKDDGKILEYLLYNKGLYLTLQQACRVGPLKFDLRDNIDKFIEARVEKVWRLLIERHGAQKLFEILSSLGMGDWKEYYVMVTQTDGLSADLYREAFDFLRDKTRNKESNLWNIDATNFCLKSIAQRDNTPVDVFLSTVEYLGVENFYTALPRLKRLGKHASELRIITEMVEAIKYGNKTALAEIYNREPQKTFLEAIDRLSVLDTQQFYLPKILELDFLPEAYLNKKLNSPRLSDVRVASVHEKMFRKVYISDYPEFVATILNGAGKVGRSFLLTILPVIKPDESGKDELKAIADRVDKLSLHDNSFLEYYLISLTFLACRAFNNGFVTPDKRLPVINGVLGIVEEAVASFGKTDEATFFDSGHDRTIGILLRNSVFAGKVQKEISKENLKKWDTLLTEGVWGVAVGRSKDFEDIEIGEFAVSFNMMGDFRAAVLKDIQRVLSSVWSDQSRYVLTPNPAPPKRVGRMADNGTSSAAGISGDVSLMGGVTPYGTNLEGTWRAELGHHMAEHILPLNPIYLGPPSSLNVMLSLYEFDDRTAKSGIPSAFDTPAERDLILKTYQDLDRSLIKLGKGVIENNEDLLDKLLVAIKTLQPEDFGSRTEFLYVESMELMLESIKNGYARTDALKTVDYMVIGRGLFYLANKKETKAILEPFTSLIEAIREEVSKVETSLPVDVRQYMDGGLFLSTYLNPFNTIGVPLQPLIPFGEILEGGEAHLTAEWLAYYSKLCARSLLADEKLSYEDYAYFVRNVPFVTKKDLKDGELSILIKRDIPYPAMSRIISLIRNLTPEALFTSAKKEASYVPNLKELHARVIGLEEEFLNDPEMGIDDLFLQAHVISKETRGLIPK